MACASSADSDAYYRCYKALHLVTLKAIPCVDNCLKVWHGNQTVGPCATGKCPQGRKPMQRVSCQNCVGWANAVEGMLYQPQSAKTQITWPNVNSSALSQSHIEAAKAFVLRLPKKKPPSSQTTASAGPHQTYTSIGDFDSASLLMIMTRFKPFHGGDLASCQTIQKVAEMRNKLSHMCLGEDMKIHNHQVSNYFKDLNSLVDCLYNLHPGHFTAAADIRAKLVAIESEPVTEAMKEDVQLQMRQDIREMSQHSKEQHKETQEAFYENRETTRRMEGKIDDLTESFARLGKDVRSSNEAGDQPSSTQSPGSRHQREPQLEEGDASLHQTVQIQYNVSGDLTVIEGDQTNIHQSTTGIPETFSEEDLTTCQRELQDFYSNKMGKVNLLPWIPDVVEEMESIFVDLELIKQETFKSTEKVQKIERNEDLVTLKSNQGLQENRIIVLGDSGSGKSTMAANIAYKWAKQDPQSSLSRFSLVFLVGMHDVENKDASLLDLIFNQILPEDTKVLKVGLKSYMSQHAEEILLVVDGMDEDSFGLLQNQSSTLTKVLHNKELRKCCVILSSRPHKISELGEHLAYYTQVKLKGFSENNINQYIQRFLGQDQEKIDHLVAIFNAKPHFKAMASIPVLLLMICLLFDDEGTLPNTKTKLYQATINHLWKRYKSKERQSLTDDSSDDDEFENDLHHLINTLGEAIVNGIQQHDGKVLFNKKELGVEVFSLGCRVGIISSERLRSKLKSKTLVTFLHTSFQDFCAGVYLANLDHNDAKFQNILRKLGHWSEGDFFTCSPILDFCCGIKPNLSRVHVILQQMLSMQDEMGKYLTDISFHLSHIYESQLSYDEYLKLVPLYSSANNVRMAISHQSVPHVLYLLKMSESSATEHSGLFSTLHYLHIDTSSIIPHLSSILKYTTNLDYFRMDTNDSNMKTSDLTDTYKAIDTLPKLTELVLMNNESDTSLDATDLLHMLTRNKPNTFELLALRDYQFDATVMAEFLVHSKSTLTFLNLWGTLDASGQPTVDMDVVIKVLPDLNKLDSLCLYHYIVAGAVEHLRPIVPQLHSLVLENCALQEKHLLQLFSFLHTAHELTDLDLSRNAFSVSSVTSLVGCLNEMPHLEELGLQGTGLNDESACILAQGLKDKSALSELDLEINPGIGPRGQDALKGLPCVLLI